MRKVHKKARIRRSDDSWCLYIGDLTSGVLEDYFVLTTKAAVLTFGQKFGPLLGAMHAFIGKNNEDILKVIDQILDDYSSPAKAWFGPVLAILVDSPEDLKIILNSPNCLQKAFPYDFLRVNCGLMSAPAEMWKTHRKYLNPCFNPKLLQSFLPIFNVKSKTMGNETSALSVSFCLLMLAMHQDIQERVVDELRSVFDTKDQPVTPEAVSKLEYLSMVMNETLRLFPITPLIGREALKDTKLDKFEIPAGACIIMPIYKVHRNKKLWGENAHLFNPDNFLPENVEKRHPYCFLPFSQGPRNCIGWRYSLLAMKTMLCHLLRNYKFTTHIKYHELKFKMCLDLKITNKHMVQIERRDFK
ncbi:probable cytochrome P450 313a4 [Culicoides brevitarsis]|uniref:probable cytochrome P450 313a4 n=1 Tax=Culicoides brevitarsis TaxID=469753 RepID=UPI00307C353D